jgi:RHS repeat-associated protein
MDPRLAQCRHSKQGESSIGRERRDARNQLIAVMVGTHRSEFTYDGEQQRVRIVEKENGVIQTDTEVLWCDSEICEERAANGITVTRRAFLAGEQVAGAARFLLTDHLASVRAVTGASGSLLARYTFDAWGRREVETGSDVTSVGFTGHQWHAAGAESLTQYRGYDPELGRWISEDPAGSPDGPNTYAYAQGNPIKFFDPDGLAVVTCCGMTSAPPKPKVMTGLECMSKCLKATILVSSGWRTKKQNDAAPGHAKKSQHLLGLAADVHIPPSMIKIREAASECGFFVLPKRYPNRVHIDLRGGRQPKTDPDDCACEKIRRLP